MLRGLGGRDFEAVNYYAVNELLVVEYIGWVAPG